MVGVGGKARVDEREARRVGVRRHACVCNSEGWNPDSFALRPLVLRRLTHPLTPLHLNSSSMADFTLPPVIDNDDGSWGPTTVLLPGAFKESVPLPGL